MSEDAIARLRDLMAKFVALRGMTHPAATTMEYLAAASRVEGECFAFMNDHGKALLALADAVNWQPIETAPRDGSRVLLLFKESLPARGDNFSGIPFVGKWSGSRLSAWGFAAPVGMVGFPDEWLAGWIPLPATPSLVALPEGDPS